MDEGIIFRMDIFFQDPDEIPLPPAEVRIRELRAEPWPDGRRVRVYLEIDPFQEKPNADLRICTADDQELATASIIETMMRKMEMTLHLRGASPSGTYTLSATLFYAEPEETSGDEPPGQKITVVDQAETKFVVERYP